VNNKLMWVLVASAAVELGYNVMTRICVVINGCRNNWGV